MIDVQDQIRLGAVKPLEMEPSVSDQAMETLGKTFQALVLKGVTSTETILVELTRKFLEQNGEKLTERERNLLAGFTR